MSHASSPVIASRPQALPVARVAPPPATELLPVGALTHPLWLSLAATLILGAWVLFDLQGWEYYTTPLRVRGYHPAHRALRSSGAVAHLLGIGGWLMMLVPVAYAARKRLRVLQRAGSLRTWLEIHIFCGLVGPVLVTFHTSFKFNGLISVAYWSMVVVAASGVVGRYLYVRIPKTIRGVELTRDEVHARERALAASLDETAGAVRQALATFDTGPWWNRAVASRVREWRLRRMLVDAGMAARDARLLAASAAERALLADRLVSLERTRRLFGLWHVFHLPLVWIMFGIVTLHIGLTLYLGYWPSLDW
jgi:hypothetical protein